MIIACYARDGDYHEALYRVDALTRGGSELFIAVGDWNKNPTELSTSLWMGQLKSQVLVADQGRPTCFTEAHTTIDFAILRSKCSTME